MAKFYNSHQLQRFHQFHLHVKLSVNKLTHFLPSKSLKQDLRSWKWLDRGCRADRLYVVSYEGQIWPVQSHASDPPVEDDKETSKLVHRLCSLLSAVDCGGWAGTTETQWHRAGTNVNLWWKTMADCFLLLKHYSWLGVGSNKKESHWKGALLEVSLGQLP